MIATEEEMQEWEEDPEAFANIDLKMDWLAGPKVRFRWNFVEISMKIQRSHTVSDRSQSVWKVNPRIIKDDMIHIFTAVVLLCSREYSRHTRHRHDSCHILSVWHSLTQMRTDMYEEKRRETRNTEMTGRREY